MTVKDDCIFCKIANHEIESNYVYEDDLVCAFRDMSPLAPTHVLIVPKQHYDSIMDDVPAEVLAAIAHAVKEIAKSEGITESGLRCVTNVGEDGGQTVKHFHVHVLGGRKLSPDMGEGFAK